MNLTNRDLSEMRENAKCANSDLSIALDYIDTLHSKIDGLFDHIKHGDTQHQQWLKREIAKHFQRSHLVGVINDQG